MVLFEKKCTLPKYKSKGWNLFHLTSTQDDFPEMSNQLAPLWERYVIYVSLESKSNESGKFPCIKNRKGLGYLPGSEKHIPWKVIYVIYLPNRKGSSSNHHFLGRTVKLWECMWKIKPTLKPTQPNDHRSSQTKSPTTKKTRRQSCRHGGRCCLLYSLRFSVIAFTSKMYLEKSGQMGHQMSRAVKRLMGWFGGLALQWILGILIWKFQKKYCWWFRNPIPNHPGCGANLVKLPTSTGEFAGFLNHQQYHFKSFREKEFPSTKLPSNGEVLPEKDTTRSPWFWSFKWAGDNTSVSLPKKSPGTGRIQLPPTKKNTHVTTICLEKKIHAK